jgi:hypothetical protein
MPPQGSPASRPNRAAWLAALAGTVILSLGVGVTLGSLFLRGNGEAPPDGPEASAAFEMPGPGGLTPEQRKLAEQVRWRKELAEAQEELAGKQAQIRELQELVEQLRAGEEPGLLWGADEVQRNPDTYVPIPVSWLEYLNISPHLLARVRNTAGAGGPSFYQMSPEERTIMLIDELFLLNDEETAALRQSLEGIGEKIEALELEHMELVEESEDEVIVRIAPFSEKAAPLKERLTRDVTAAVGENRFEYIWPILENSLRDNYQRFGALERTITVTIEGSDENPRYRVREKYDYVNGGTGSRSMSSSRLPERYRHLFDEAADPHASP